MITTSQTGTTILLVVYTVYSGDGRSTIKCSTIKKQRTATRAAAATLASWFNKGGNIALNWKPISELWCVTCRMGPHSVTCHPTQVNPSQIGWYSIYLPQRKKSTNPTRRRVTLLIRWNALPLLQATNLSSN